MPANHLDNLCVNTIRFLAADAVQAANSGHPGLPMGAAVPAYVLWNRYLKFNPADPRWFNRDRFVLSAGHGSALLYSLLHLTGFDLPLEEIKNFRQWGSKTPGHPENILTPGVEATTGPLGQGLANAVGMALAESWLGHRFNRPRFDLIDHHTYVLASDGDLMEGISSEAASLAGHLKLSKLIVLYDSNDISIEGSTSLAFSENVRKRFEALGWGTHFVADGNDFEAVSGAVQNARNESDRPSFIEIKTHLGFGSPNKQDTASAHGEPLGEEELEKTRENLGWPRERFHIPKEALDYFRKARARGEYHQNQWQKLFDSYKKNYPEQAAELEGFISGNLNPGWDENFPRFISDDGPLATRAASGKCLNHAAGKIPKLIGGSADLAPSNKTIINDSADFSVLDREGRNLRFGVREHAMGAILNGMALHGGVHPYGGTFLIFSDYMKPAIRLAALSHLPVIYIFTHDSLGVGEDGPTHQPVEQLAGLRAIPNLTVIRPADANETSLAWRFALANEDGPVAMVFSRQKLPVFDPEEYPAIEEGLFKGVYILAETNTDKKPDLILAATGSEVSLAEQTRQKLEKKNHAVRLVSCPSWEIFRRQPEEYRRKLFPEDVPIIAIEAGASMGWPSDIRGIVDIIGVDRFGASAPGATVLEKYGFNVGNIVKRAEAVLKNHKPE